ncbi:MAG: PilZ domain-containing protein [Bryobacteraceae bacterium]|jgi:ribosomal protein L35AE/L33A
MNVSVREMRREQRRKAEGAVRVSFANPKPVQIDGRLVDVSAGGFRMSHTCTSLSAGQLVEFKHAESAGQAQVMWNRVASKHVETGFRVVTAGAS